MYILNGVTFYDLFSLFFPNNKLMRHRFSGCARRYVIIIKYSDYFKSNKLRHDNFFVYYCTTGILKYYVIL